jgi:anti-anti-sigma regulatory factor
MPTPLSLSVVRREDESVVLTATGEIDMSNIDVFADALTGATLVDLSGVEYLDSGGINALFANADHIHVIANPLLLAVLKISGLTDVVSVESAGPPAD